MVIKLYINIFNKLIKYIRNHEMFKENNKYRPLIEISTTTDKNINVPSFIGGKILNNINL